MHLLPWQSITNGCTLVDSSQTYDLTFVGGGPLNLLSALAHSKLGKRTLVVEAKGKIGGAWSTTILPDVGEVEIGCHIWDYSPEVYSFLQDYLDLDLQHLKPAPRIHFGKMSFRYEQKSSVLYLREKFRQMKSLRIGQFLNPSRSKHSPSLKPIKFLYPSGGSRELVKRLRERLSKSSVDILVNCPIKEIDISGVEATLSSPSHVIKTKKVVVTSNGHFSLKGKNGLIKLRWNHSKFVHVHIVIRDALKLKLSYIRLFNDPVIHRISDVSDQLAEKGYTVILAGIHPEAMDRRTEEHICAYVLDKLKSLGYIKADIEAKSFHFNEYPGKALSPESINELSARPDKIHFQYTRNFTKDLQPHVPMLRKALL